MGTFACWEIRVRLKKRLDLTALISKCVWVGGWLEWVGAFWEIRFRLNACSCVGGPIWESVVLW